MNINLTLVGQMISFALFVWVTMRYVWPPIVQAMQERQKRIADGLAAAKRGQEEREQAERQVKQQLDEAKQQASDIIQQAQRRANEIVEEAKSDAREEGERIKQAAQDDVQLEINRAREALRKQVGAIAVAGAEKVLGREIDAKAHSAVLDDLVTQI